MTEHRHASELAEMFVNEHRKLMRGLVAVLQKVEAADLVAARRLADELDQSVGPHIQFEEEVLYPIVGRARGKQYETELRGEHTTVQQAIKCLVDSDPSDADLGDLQNELEAALKVAVDHAESCGTLISHLEALSPETQQQALARHTELCQQGVRWTQLSSEDSPAEH